MKAWEYDEFRHVGTDYASVEEVRAYDERMGKVRNIAEEADLAFDALQVTKESRLLEIGTGTGQFALRAAARCAHVYAADISQAMLEYARQRAADLGITNITFKQAGFLSYQHEGEPLDAVVSQLALHHLPDFWKGIALKKVWDMLRKGGRFYLRDTVFPWHPDHNAADFERWISGLERVAGREMAREASAHIREEYSTFDWIMEGLLKSVGFNILSADYARGFAAEYVCMKG